MPKCRVGVIGCGLIGARRAEQVANHPGSTLVCVADSNKKSAEALAAQFHVRTESDWRAVINNPDIDAVVVSTPNGFLHEIASAALKKGKHVLIEKPMGRNLSEALSLGKLAAAKRKILKIGFNHRYHPAIARAHSLFKAGKIGSLINIRARYGHGGRPGYEKEWRGNPKLAGGGELTDQGVHILDLIHWFAGAPREAFGYLQTAIWPIKPLEDNGFALFKFNSGAVASFHTSWTQWKNLFSFEIFGTKGALVIEGLGRSYGVEKLTVYTRRIQGGVPYTKETVFSGPDLSWKLEWIDFLGAITRKKGYLGTPQEGILTMKMLASLYASAKSRGPVRL